MVELFAVRFKVVVNISYTCNQNRSLILVMFKAPDITLNNVVFGVRVALEEVK